MDQHPNIMCNFENPGEPGSFSSIFVTGIAMFLVYGIGFPLFMLLALYGRSKRWVLRIAIETPT